MTDAAKSKAAALLAKYPVADGRRRCAIADSGHGGLVDDLRAVGAGNARISSILRAEFGLILSVPTIQRHTTRTCCCGLKP